MKCGLEGCSYAELERMLREAEVNPVHAHKLAALLKGMDAHVNLIPLNPTEGFEGQAPDEADVRAFQQIIQEAGLPSTVRQRRGIDVAAGCGQLKAKRRSA